MARSKCPKCDNTYICNQCACCQNCGLDVDSSEANEIELEGKEKKSIFCDYCSLKCIASDCECLCHKEKTE